MQLILFEEIATQQHLTSHRPCKINNFTETTQAKLIRIVHGHLNKFGTRGHCGF